MPPARTSRGRCPLELLHSSAFRAVERDLLALGIWDGVHRNGGRRSGSWWWSPSPRALAGHLAGLLLPWWSPEPVLVLWEHPGTPHGASAGTLGLLQLCPRREGFGGTRLLDEAGGVGVLKPTLSSASGRSKQRWGQNNEALLYFWGGGDGWGLAVPRTPHPGVRGGGFGGHPADPPLLYTLTHRYPQSASALGGTQISSSWESASKIPFF